MPRCSAVAAQLLMTALVWVPGAVLGQAEEKIPDEAEAQAICARFDKFKHGAEAVATEADRKAFAKVEDCKDFVYDTGEGTDYDKGRRCCLARGDCNRELAVIFANGWGVRRDYDAATYFLCRAGDEMAPFEQWEMLGHVEGMRKAKQPKDLDFCDYAESGTGTSWCASLDLERKSKGWESRTAAVRGSLGTAAQASLAELRKAADAFIEANAEAEAAVSLGGTIYPTLVLGGQADGNESFVSALERFSRQRAPAASPEALQKADTALNAAYKAAMSREEFDEEHSLSKSLREAQRAWIRYRDAWTSFYRLRWKDAAPPDALDREIGAALTAQRAEELRKLMEEE